MVPASGGYTPVRTLISVDLPAPFWPMSACTSPARNVSSTPASACTPGKARAMSRALSTIAAPSFIRSVLACLDELPGRVHGEHGFLDDDAFRDRPARDDFGGRGHELRA